MYRRHPLSGTQCARVLELAYEKGATLSQLKLIRKTCSFVFQLDTGITSENYPVVAGMFKSFDITTCSPPTRSLKPTRIPDIQAYKDAWTREWRYVPGGMCLLDFLTASLKSWDEYVLGNRSGVDMNKIKDSRTHYFSLKYSCWATKYVGGRSKLCMHKKGTRDWWAWRHCVCRGGVHVSPAEDFEYTFDRNGNTSEDLSRYTTTCPLFCGEVLHRKQHGALGCYRKWVPAQDRFGKSNHGDLHELSNRWFRFQGVLQDGEAYDKNSGRKGLALWMSETGCSYPEGHDLMGDTEDTWRKSYQPDLPCSGGYKVRDQRTDPFVVTSALRRFQNMIGRSKPMPSLDHLTAEQQVLMKIATKLGLGTEATRIFTDEL